MVERTNDQEFRSLPKCIQDAIEIEKKISIKKRLLLIIKSLSKK